jgi:hypothetical protein
MWNLVIGSLSKSTKARVQDYFKLSWISLWLVSEKIYLNLNSLATYISFDMYQTTLLEYSDVISVCIS